MADVWTAFLDNQTEIETYALRKGDRAKQWLGDRGIDLGELEMESLVNHVFQENSAGKAIWDPRTETIFQFFVRHIHNRVRSFELLRRGPHIAVVNTGSDEDEGEGDVAIDALLVDPCGVQNIMDGVEWPDLLRFLAKSDQRLPRLARLVYEGYEPGEQTREMQLSESSRYRLHRKLVAELIRYRDLDQQSPQRSLPEDPASRDVADRRNKK